jgi:hypothetical protein
MTKMDLLEARRRFEKLLVEHRYSMSGVWTDKYHEEESKYKVSSMALKDMSNTRAVLWYEAGNWQGMISIAVGEDGEFPIVGGRIIRAEDQPWKLLHFNFLSKKIEGIRYLVRKWDFGFPGELGDKAMMKLALSYLREHKIKKGISILLGALRGEISMATISESLSIVQTRWCRSREERLRSALIWSNTFK